MFYPGPHQRLLYIHQRKTVTRDKIGFDSSNSLREWSCLPGPSPSLSLGDPHLDEDHSGRRRSSTSSPPSPALPMVPTNELQPLQLKQPCWAERTGGMGGSAQRAAPGDALQAGAEQMFLPWGSAGDSLEEHQELGIRGLSPRVSHQ